MSHRLNMLALALVRIDAFSLGSTVPPARSQSRGAGIAMDGRLVRKRECTVAACATGRRRAALLMERQHSARTQIRAMIVPPRHASRLCGFSEKFTGTGTGTGTYTRLPSASTQPQHAGSFAHFLPSHSTANRTLRASGLTLARPARLITALYTDMHVRLCVFGE